MLLCFSLELQHLRDELSTEDCVKVWTLDLLVLIKRFWKVVGKFNTEWEDTNLGWQQLLYNNAENKGSLGFDFIGFFEEKYKRNGTPMVGLQIHVYLGNSTVFFRVKSIISRPVSVWSSVSQKEYIYRIIVIVFFSLQSEFK